MRDHRSILFLALVFLLPCFSSAQTMDTRIQHDKIGFAALGQPIYFEARLEGGSSQGDVSEAKVWYRASGDDVYDFFDLYPEGAQFTGSLPSDKVPAEGLDYYLEFTFTDGTVITYPQTTPQENPLSVTVRSGAATGDESVIVLSPNPNEILPEGEVLIALSFNQSIRAIDPGDVVLRVDGINRTGKANITPDVLTAVIKGMANGKHIVEVFYHGPKGRELLTSFSFRIKTPEKESFLARGNLHGNAGLELRHQKIGGFSRNVANEILGLSYKTGRVEIGARARLTSEEQKRLQPQHRYQAYISMPYLGIRIGDIQPRYNELMLWGRRVRGTELRLGKQYGKINLHAIYGELNRKVEGSIRILPGGTGGTTDTLTSYGTHKRWLGAARIAFGSRNVQFGITGMKIKDDTGSIQYGNEPKDNLLAGADFTLYADRKRVSISAHSALSLYNDDTSEDPFEDADQFKNIIWINTHFIPLPEGIVESGDQDSTSNSIDMGKVIKSILQKATSHKAKLRLRYMNNDLQIGYKLINHSFRSLANPTLTKDRKGFFASDRIRLLKSRLYLNGGFSSYEDNVSGDADYTTIDRQYNIGFSAYTGEHLPDFTVSFRNRKNYRDGAADSSYFAGFNPSGDSLYQTIYTLKETKTNFVTFNLSHSLPLTLPMLNTNNEINFSIINGKTEDAYDTLGLANSEQMSYSFSLKSRFDNPLESYFAISQSTQKAMDSRTDVTYNTFITRFDYRLLNNRLNLYFGPRVTGGSGTSMLSPYSPAEILAISGMDTTTAEAQAEIQEMNFTSAKNLIIDFMKTDWIGGFDFRIIGNHTLRGFISLTSYTEKSQYEYYNGTRFDVSQQTVQNGTYTFTQSSSTINRDDVMMTLTYSYRF